MQLQKEGLGSYHPDHKYLGAVWENFTEVGGRISLKKLHLYRISGDRRWALTEVEARAHVAEALVGIAG